MPDGLNIHSVSQQWHIHVWPFDPAVNNWCFTLFTSGDSRSSLMATRTSPAAGTRRLIVGLVSRSQILYRGSSPLSLHRRTVSSSNSAHPPKTSPLLSTPWRTYDQPSFHQLCRCSDKHFPLFSHAIMTIPPITPKPMRPSSSIPPTTAEPSTSHGGVHGK